MLRLTLSASSHRLPSLPRQAKHPWDTSASSASLLILLPQYFTSDLENYNYPSDGKAEAQESLPLRSLGYSGLHWGSCVVLAPKLVAVSNAVAKWPRPCCCAAAVTL